MWPLLYLVFFLNTLAGSVEITSRLGDIIGVDSLTITGKPYTSFFGVPYALPPLGPLSFKKPVPALPWNGTFEAKNQISCLQLDDWNPDVAFSGQEDCLVLNIHTTNALKSEFPLPVMVFIHGGLFISGSGGTGTYGPERLLDYGVVLVTVNYRLGPLGFLSTGDDVIPGNIGLWDQHLALKWVQDNILDFGGDPNLVTLFGESAGSMAVSYHVLSPQSPGLFHRAIMQSGAATTTHIKADHSPKFYSKKMAESVGCQNADTSEDILQCFKEVGAKEIVKNRDIFVATNNLPRVYKPIVDELSSDPFVPLDPWKAIDSGNFTQVPIIMGSNKDEGLVSALGYHQQPDRINSLAEKWDSEFGPLFIFHRSSDTLDEDILELSRNVSEFFMPVEGKPSKENILKGFCDLYGDVNYKAIVSITARAMAAKSSSSVFEYLYKHMGSYGNQEFLSLPEWKQLLKIWGQKFGLDLFPAEFGVSHADELFMIFKAHDIPLETVFNSGDKQASKNLLKLWTNFARTGNPTPEISEFGLRWDSLNSESDFRLEIGTGTIEMSLDEDLERRINFLRDILKR